MANIIIIAVIAALAVISIKSYLRKLSYGCCGTGADKEKKIKVSDNNLSNYPCRAVMNIEGMTCKNCKRRIENYFNSIDGMWAEVNLKGKKAVVYSKTVLSTGEISDIVAKAGYLAENIIVENRA